MPIKFVDAIKRATVYYRMYVPRAITAAIDPQTLIPTAKLFDDAMEMHSLFIVLNNFATQIPGVNTFTMPDDQFRPPVKDNPLGEFMKAKANGIVSILEQFDGRETVVREKIPLLVKKLQVFYHFIPRFDDPTLYSYATRVAGGFKCTQCDREDGKHTNHMLYAVQHYETHFSAHHQDLGVVSLGLSSTDILAKIVEELEPDPLDISEEDLNEILADPFPVNPNDFFGAIDNREGVNFLSSIQTQQQQGKTISATRKRKYDDRGGFISGASTSGTSSAVPFGGGSDAAGSTAPKSEVRQRSPIKRARSADSKF